MSRKGIFALESMEEQVEDAAKVVVAEAETSEVEAENEPVVIDESAGAEDLMEADEYLETASEVEGAVEDATATVDTLGEIRKEVGNSLAEGGMSEPEARALEIAVEHMCAAIGMSKAKKSVFPAMESFANKKDRISATKYAMEGLVDKAKEIGATIIKAIMKALEYAKQFFTSLFNATNGLKMKADQIVEAAKQAKAGGEEAHSVSGGFLNLLTVDGKYQVGNALVAAYTKHVAEPAIKYDHMGLVRDIAPILEKALQEKEADTANASMEQVFAEIEKKHTFVEGKDADVCEEPLVFAGQSFYIEMTDTKTTVRIGDSSSKKEVSPLKEAPALSIKNVQDLAAAVSAHMESYKSLSKDVGVLSGEVNAIIQKVKAAMSGEGSVTSAIYSQIQTLNNVTVVASKLVRSYDVKVSSAILEYCVKSLKAIPKAEKAEKVEEVKPA